MLQKALNILLLPIYAHFLLPEQYGIFALLNTCGQVAAPLLSIGLGPALIWAVVYRRMNAPSVFGSAIAFLLLFGLLMTGLLILIAPHIAIALFGNTTHADLLRLVVVAMFFSTSEYLFITQCRMTDRIRLLAAVIGARIVFIAGLQILFLVLGMGVAGLVLAQLITALLFGTAVMIRLWSQSPPLFHMPDIGPLLRHGWPMLPFYLSGIVMTASDRFFLQHYRNEYEVGLYALGYNVGMVINIIVYSMQTVWLKHLFDIARDDPRAPQTISRLTTYYLLFLGGVGLALALLSREIIGLLTPEAYHASHQVVPLIVMAYILNGWTLFTNIGMKLTDKNHLISPIVAGAATLNLALNFALIPRYGMMGAAWATLLSYGAQHIAFFVIDQRLWKVPYETVRLVKIAAVLLFIYCVAAHASTFGHVTNVAVKLASLALVPAALWAVRFPLPEEVQACRAWRAKRRAPAARNTNR